MENRNWTVVVATGQRIDLECGAERKEVRRPKDPTGLQMFLGIRPGQMIDDATLRTFLGVED
jgi:hypothetical protein